MQSPYVLRGEELPLTNRGQLELLRGMAESGATLRTVARGSSMTPFIRDGDVLTVTPLQGHAPAVGDVIAASLPSTGRLAIHRVISRQATGWIIRGDGAAQADGIVPPDNVLGRVTAVERQGRRVRLGIGLGATLLAGLSRTGVLTRLIALSRLPARLRAMVLRIARRTH